MPLTVLLFHFLVCSTVSAGFICAGPSWVRSRPRCSWKMLCFLLLDVWSRSWSVIGGYSEDTCWRFLVALVCISFCFRTWGCVGGCTCTVECTRGDFQSQDFTLHTFVHQWIFILKVEPKPPVFVFWSQASLQSAYRVLWIKPQLCESSQSSFLRSGGHILRWSEVFTVQNFK